MPLPTTDDYLLRVDEVVDAQLADLRSCVTFARAVDEDYTHRVQLKLSTTGTQAKVTPVDTSIKELWIPRCFAQHLSAVVWPDAGASKGVMVTLQLHGTEPQRVEHAFYAAGSAPEGVAKVMNDDALNLAIRRQVHGGEHCLRSHVRAESKDTSGRMELEYSVDAAGAVSRKSAAGAEALPEMRECFLKEFDGIHLAAGYSDTVIRASLEFSGEGGEWAPGDRSIPSHAEVWDWHYRWWLYQPAGDTTPTPPETAPERWAYAVSHQLESKAKDFAGCLIEADAKTGGYDVLLVGGAKGLDAAVVHTSAGPASAAQCVARVARRVWAPPAAARWVLTTRIEMLPGPITLVGGPVPITTATGPWSAALVAAAMSGDKAATTAALGGETWVTAKDWSEDLPAAPADPRAYLWTAGGGWPKWDRLLLSPGDEALATTASLRLPTFTESCRVRYQGDLDSWLVLEIEVNTFGRLAVQEVPLHGNAAPEVLSCIKTKLEVQSVDAAAGAFTVLMPFSVTTR